MLQSECGPVAGGGIQEENLLLSEPDGNQHPLGPADSCLSSQPTRGLLRMGNQSWGCLGPVADGHC